MNRAVMEVYIDYGNGLIRDVIDTVELPRCLTGRLFFGNTEQIEALRVIEDTALAIEEDVDCKIAIEYTDDEVLFLADDEG